MRCTKDELSSFQEFLLDTLYTYDDINIIQQQLNCSVKNSFLLAWSFSIDPDMLEVAARMVQHWGIKS